MTDATTSPLTDEESEQTPDEVFEIVFFRVSATNAEWDEDPASKQFDLTCEEAATRLANEDYSPLS